MQAYRQIVDGKQLDKIMKLPGELRHKQVEIIVLPVKNKQRKKKKLSQNWANALSDYREQTLNPGKYFDPDATSNITDIQPA